MSVMMDSVVAKVLRRKLRQQPALASSFHRMVAAATADTLRVELERGGGRALSIRRPWAQLIVDGHKTVENRPRPTRHRGLIVIHAGQAWDPDGADLARALAVGEEHLRAQACPSGYLGVARLVDAHPAAGCCAPWGRSGADMWHWRFADPVRFPKAIPGRGQLGLFRIPPTAHDAVIDQVSQWVSQAVLRDFGLEEGR
ncbi:ASCH domain-containing protein [Nocardia transvalensis]|uniref:ASCH domain-containing protein n=1 Tax=Nocardia transvalensis TaxID=37333 RepID=UPI001894835F|nr:ASCH domain-containing protein [Nocardia transvalensis]MBF6333592.1 ASCH domain-containing protein [Nocardia transvalensis]